MKRIINKIRHHFQVWSIIKYLERKTLGLKEKIDSLTVVSKQGNKIFVCWLQGIENAPNLEKEVLKI